LAHAERPSPKKNPGSLEFSGNFPRTEKDYQRIIRKFYRNSGNFCWNRLSDDLASLFCDRKSSQIGRINRRCLVQQIFILKHLC